jgi:hypothetical protein
MMCYRISYFLPFVATDVFVSSFLLYSYYTREIGYEHLLCITRDEIQISIFS